MRNLSFTFVLLAALAMPLLSVVLAQTAAPQKAAKAGGAKVGAVDLVAQSAQYRPGLLHFQGQVKMTSKNYDLAGEDVKVFSTRAAGGQETLKNAVVEGNLKAGQQVVAHIRQPSPGQAEETRYEILADHAVYVPDTSRPSGGKMDFTGNVKVTTNSGFLAGPSVTTTDRATILLGQGDDYPQLSTGSVHLLATPAQQ